MKPRITVITLGVDDLQRRSASTATASASDGGIVGRKTGRGVLQMQPGLLLAIWRARPRAGCRAARRPAPRVSLGHNVSSRAEVDGHGAGREAGRSSRAQDTFWGGYSGYFQDPDGHLWEVVWNPDLQVEAESNG